MSDLINHSLYEMALGLTITFMVPLIGGIIGTIMSDLAALLDGKKDEKEIIGRKRLLDYRKGAGKEHGPAGLAMQEELNIK